MRLLFYCLKRLTHLLVQQRAARHSYLHPDLKYVQNVVVKDHHRQQRTKHNSTRIAVRLLLADGGLPRSKVRNQPSKTQRLEDPTDKRKNPTSNPKVKFTLIMWNYLENESTEVYRNPFDRMVHP